MARARQRVLIASDAKVIEGEWVGLVQETSAGEGGRGQMAIEVNGVCQGEL